MMTHYSIEPRARKNAKVDGFLLFVKIYPANSEDNYWTML